MDYPNLLKHYRSVADLSQRDLAALVSRTSKEAMSHSLISLIEQGKNIPRHSTKVKLATALNLNIHDIFPDEFKIIISKEELFECAKMFDGGDKVWLDIFEEFLEEFFSEEETDND